MSKDDTEKFVTQLKENGLEFLRKNILRVMPNPLYSVNTNHNMFMDVEYNKILKKHEITISAANTGGNMVEVQYLPWSRGAGIYMCLKQKPDIFLTDKLTGCYVAFVREQRGIRVVHMNFECDTQLELNMARQSYEKCTVIGPEEYTSDGTVLGVNNKGI